jgi:hypothetical protein
MGRIRRGREWRRSKTGGGLSSPASPGGMPVGLPVTPCLACPPRAIVMAPQPEWYRSPRQRSERASHGRSQPSARFPCVILGVSGRELWNRRKTLSANVAACRSRSWSSGLGALTRLRRKIPNCLMIPGFSMFFLAPCGVTRHRGERPGEITRPGASLLRAARSVIRISRSRNRSSAG